MKALLIETNIPEWMTNAALKEKLQPLLPNVDIRYAPDFGDRADIVMLACVRLPPGLVATLPNLKLVQKLGAGVETIVDDPDLPEHVSVTRLKPEDPAREIAEYCLAYVLQAQRNIPFHAANQLVPAWVPKAPRKTKETTIGVLGLGHIGGYTARLFTQLGFKVIGWSRTPKEIEGVDCRFGADQLKPLLSSSDYVAAILPSTAATRDLFNREMFNAFKPGATLINAGRGDLIKESDLIDALDRGGLGHAVLDVFQREPLPLSHPFWPHPRITITPHVSGWHVDGALEVVADNYYRLVEDRPLLNLVDKAAGY